jgi:hypothetical protein
VTGDWIVEAVVAERRRQRAKWNTEHAWGVGDCSSAHVADPVKVSVLSEECGEVARAVLDQDEDALRIELIQVAAVACAWLEALGES